MEMPGTTDIGPGTRMLLRLWQGLNEPGSGPAAEEDWQSFLAACDFHQVGPIVFHRFRTSVSDPVVPEPVMDRLRARFYQVSAYNHRLAMLLVELGADSNTAGFRSWR